MRFFTLAFILCLASLTPATSSTAQDDRATVRVALFSGTNPVTVDAVAVGAPLKMYANRSGEPLLTVDESDTLTVRRGPIDLQVLAGDLDINLADLYLKPESGGSVVLIPHRERGELESRRYEGEIRISLDAGDRRIRLVNRVDLETYVAAVVAREYSLDDDEGTRAMAIVARTYAVRSQSEGGGVVADDHSSQVYHGVDAITEKSRAAADMTRGLILTYDRMPISALYSASNGGYSADATDVWSGSPLPYLRARRDRFDRKASPYIDWTFKAAAAEVHEAISSHLGLEVTRVVVASRGPDGRAKMMRIESRGGGATEIRGNEFRTLVSNRLGSGSLKSTLFEMRQHGDDYEFTGSGFGHGVGLSQWGTHEMATRGYNHAEILRYYYPGAEVLPVADDLRASAVASETQAETSAAADDKPRRTVTVSSGRIMPKTWAGGVDASQGERTGARPRIGW